MIPRYFKEDEVPLPSERRGWYEKLTEEEIERIARAYKEYITKEKTLPENKE